MASSSRDSEEVGRRWTNLQFEDREETGVWFDQSEDLGDEFDSRGFPFGYSPESSRGIYWKICDIVPKEFQWDLEGLLSCTERFYHRLFDEPLETIVKPYGLFMKAPDRRPNRQIGARWLRDSMGQSVEETMGRSPRIKKILKEKIMELKSRRNVGHVVNPELEENEGEGNIEDLVIIDNKRRRTHVGVDGGPLGDSGNMGQDFIDLNGGQVDMKVNGPEVYGPHKDKVAIGVESRSLMPQEVGKGTVEGKKGGSFSVEARGHSEGLAMLWRQENDGKLLSFSQNHIDIELKLSGSIVVRVTGCYGEPSRNLRSNTWRLIRELVRRSMLPWCLIGDLNNVLNQSDKRGGRPYPNSLLKGFQDVVSDCRLIDMALFVHPYTWERGRGTSNWVEIRLDRVLVSHAWNDLFPSARLFNMEISVSDHSPLWLQLVPTPIVITPPSTALVEWGKNITGDFKERLNKCNKVLKCLKNRRYEESIKKYKETQTQLYEILTQKEVFWRQRSKQLWLQAGDQNTKYFHACATSRKRNNHIVCLKNRAGVWAGWDNGLKEVMADYYRELFTASTSNWERVIACVDNVVSEDQNVGLTAPVDAAEVRKAVFQMHPDKSPGPDGLNPRFCQKFWEVVGTDVVRLVQHFFMFGEFPDFLKDTNIILIPKKSTPETMSDLRPIALCNVIYKIVSKVMANRLKGVLPNVISETQSAFLPGRLITDNILISFEVMHYLKRKGSRKNGFMAVKMDMSKAYDRVEWGFLQAMLRKLGLSLLIKDYERLGKVRGFKVARGAPIISHMLFADDTYVFCKANEEAACNVMELLSYFQQASRQQVNVLKSSIFFISNTRAEDRTRVCSRMGISEAVDNSTYLGLPNIVGRNKTTLLGFLKERLRKKIQGWEGRFLSKAGKELLIKTVAQSLPSYAMNVFLLTKKIYNEMEQMMCNFWWKSSSKDSKGIHWKRWDRLTLHKSKGGMEFRNLGDFNVSLLSKQGWRLLSRPDFLVARLFKARYYSRGDFLSAELGHNPSFVWRSIFEAKDLVKAGARVRIGNGAKTRILDDPWLPDEDNPRIISTHPALVDQRVQALMVTRHYEWDVELINDVMSARDAAIILRTLVEAISCCWPGLDAPEMAEVMGVREALSWIKKKLWQSVIVETDSLIVVQAIRSPLEMVSYFGSVISDCKTLLEELSGVSVLFVKRSANSVAHFLAKASYSVADRVIRSYDVSSEFQNVILYDCS
uniref:Reverse transcriptase n=1 Tax=Cannabis sativa TaxID=3483 RepID=A0A803NTG1_CANSA